MKTRLTRGVIDPGTWIIIGLITVGSYFYLKVLEPGRNKAVADQAAAAADQTQQAAKVINANADILLNKMAEIIAEHAKVVSTRDQMDKNAASFSAQAKAVLQADPNPSQYTLVAIGLLDSVESSLGIEFTPQQRKVFIDRVVPLIQHNAEVEAQLASEKAKSAALAAVKDAVEQRAKAAEDSGKLLVGQNKDLAGRLVTVSTKTASLTAKNKEWADNEQSLLGRIKALIGLAVLLVVVVVGISIKLLGVTKTRDNGIALVEQMKKWAIEAGHNATDLKQKMTDWYENDTKAQAAVAKVKAKLRL